MNDTIEIIGFAHCPSVQRVLLACLELHIPYQVSFISREDKPSWFTDLSPLGMVPLIRFSNNTLFGAQAICEFLNEANLHDQHATQDQSLLPERLLDRAKLRAWCELIDSIFVDIYNLKTGKPDLKTKSCKSIEHKFHFLMADKDASSSYFFPHNKLSLVDLSAGIALFHLQVIAQVTEFKLLSDHPGAQAWFTCLQQRPSFELVFGEETRQQYAASFHQ